MGIRQIGKSFEASYKRCGRKIRRRWKTMERAKQWLKDEQADKLISISLSGAQKLDAARALSILQRHGATLEDAACRFVMTFNLVAKKEVWTFRDACNAAIEARRDANAREIHVKHLASALRRACLVIGDKPIEEVTTDDLVKYVRSRGHLQPQTWKNYRLELGLVFNYSIRHGRATRNPAREMPDPKLEDVPVPILHVAEVRRLLAQMDDITSLYCTLGLFCGLRPYEITKIGLKSINCESYRIVVQGPHSKSRQRRFVTIPPNMKSFIEPAIGNLGSGRNYWNIRRMILQAAERANVKLSPDVFRHSFASHHLALHQNAALTAHEMGHRGQDILFRHYADRVTKEEGLEYFATIPVQTVSSVSPILS